MSVDELLKLIDRCQAMAERAPPKAKVKLLEIAESARALALEKAGFEGQTLPTQDVGLLRLQ